MEFNFASKWLDFPRAGNNNSFQYARRQWNIVDDEVLRYRYLNNFDSAMNNLEEKYNWLSAQPVNLTSVTASSHSDTLSSNQAYVSLKNEADKVIVFERAGLLFIFNFHPVQSYTDYRVGVEEAGEYHVAFTSDEKRFGGFDNISLDSKYFTTPMEWNGRKNWLQVRHLCFSEVIAETVFFRYTYPRGPVSCWLRFEYRLLRIRSYCSNFLIISHQFQ